MKNIGIIDCQELSLTEMKETNGGGNKPGGGNAGFFIALLGMIAIWALTMPWPKKR